MNQRPVPDATPISWSLGGADLPKVPPQPHDDSLHAIHNFEINIKIDMDTCTGEQPYPGRDDFGPPKTGGSGGGVANRHATSDLLATPGTMAMNGLGPTAAAAAAAVGVGLLSGSAIKPANRRLLNLQEYKKRHGLI